MNKEQDITKELFKEYQRTIQDDYSNMNVVDIAVCYLVVNRCSFSGIHNAGATSKITQRWNPDTLKKRIMAINKEKSKIKLYNMDYFELIEEEFWNNNTTIFIDLPYVKKGKLLYKHLNEKNGKLILKNIDGTINTNKGVFWLLRDVLSKQTLHVVEKEQLVQINEYSKQFNKGNSMLLDQLSLYEDSL